MALTHPQNHDCNRREPNGRDRLHHRRPRSCGHRRLWRTIGLLLLLALTDAAVQAGPPAEAATRAAPANKSVVVGGWVAVSQYRQKVLYRTGYDYGVSLMRDGGRYRMWWCGGELASGVPDRILTAESNDGVSWSTPLVALLPTPLALVADPSVVKFDGWYWMYFTGTAQADGTDNDIYLAVSVDGVNWSMYPSDAAPVPVIASRMPNPGGYGAGQPSALHLDGQFVVYFLDQDDPGGLYRAVSADGVTFPERDWVMTVNDVDVKHNPDRGYYLMVRHGQFDGVYSRACLHLSEDGLTFTPVDNELYIHGPGIGDGFQLASGVGSDPVGRIGDRSKVIYAAGTAEAADTWDLHLSELYLFPDRPDNINRFFGPATKANDHLFATAAASPAGYEFERVAWRSPAADVPGARPLFRLYSPSREDHFYTTSSLEKAQAMVWGYLDEGTCGHLLAVCTPGAIPVFRLYHANGDHHYTTDRAEVQTAVLQFGYISEGIAGYAYPPVTLPGDLTGEGEVNRADVSRLRQVLAGGLWDQPWPGGEMDGDGRLTAVDLLKLVMLTDD